MYLAFLNPQGNFDPQDSHWTAYPDFGGQLVYVKQLALAMGRMGHRVDLLTRQIIDPDWPEFAGRLDTYPGEPNVRIVRLPAGPERFLPKEELWPYLGTDWLPNIKDFFRREDRFPDVLLAHYGDGGLAAVLLSERTGIPFTFTAHSLGAQKMDKLHADWDNLPDLQRRFHFAQRLWAERLAMNRSLVNITSTRQERFQQYGHRAYRGAVDPNNDQRFAVVSPGVALEIFDRSIRLPEEESTHKHIRAMLERDIAPARRALPCIVSSSRLDPKKNHMGLVKAFSNSLALREIANLVIITADIDNPLAAQNGAGVQSPVLQAILAAADQHHLRGQMSIFALHGQKPLAAGYRYFAATHSVFALTSLYEPFGLAPLEAMAAGLPAVVTRNGGPSESLYDGQRAYGVLIDPEAPANIAAGLMQLLSDRQSWQTFAQRGYRRVVERYTWPRTATGYLEAINARWPPTSAKRYQPLIPIPSYFLDPQPGNEPTLANLAALYFDRHEAESEQL